MKLQRFATDEDVEKYAQLKGQICINKCIQLMLTEKFKISVSFKMLYQ